MTAYPKSPTPFSNLSDAPFFGSVKRQTRVSQGKVNHSSCSSRYIPHSHLSCPPIVILHASGPAARSFLSPLQSSRCGRPSFFFPAVSLLYPCPASIRLPATGLLCRTLHPPVAIRRDKRTSGCPGASYANRKWPSSALFTRPAPAGRTHAHSGALSLRVEPRQAAPP